LRLPAQGRQDHFFPDVKRWMIDGPVTGFLFGSDIRNTG
jgi:hypothetical protein